MTAADAAEALLRDLDARGFSLRAAGDRLAVRTPGGPLAPDVREAILRVKPALLSLLGVAPRELLRHADVLCAAEMDGLPTGELELLPAT